ncbi:hypothetical protein NPIL_32671 [Nephila pilipes]|uniref:Uncharacterized protein n=1 Tax=Nephila pilipes TaxID=299642 RepID=A0A8X6N9B8_NEPPI|nr:hypothetical protein NPIL_32671 [Nephila pilipes]
MTSTTERILFRIIVAPADVSELPGVFQHVRDSFRPRRRACITAGGSLAFISYAYRKSVPRFPMDINFSSDMYKNRSSTHLANFILSTFRNFCYLFRHLAEMRQARRRMAEWTSPTV